MRACRLYKLYSAAMQTQDLLILFVSAASILLSFQTSGAHFLKPTWSHTLEPGAGLEPSDEAPLPVPAPVVADLDDDGQPEVVVATRDGRLLLLDPSPRARAATATAAKWRSLPVKAEASLRSHVGLATGRRPVALQAGALHAVHPPERRAMIVVVLTEDWTVLAFDSSLRPLWEHSLGSGGAARPHGFVEAAIVVSPHGVYAGDDGVVVVAGRTKPTAADGGGAAAARASDAPSAPRRPGLGEATQHYDYFALEGGRGRPRWEHRARDFHAELHGGERLTPQMDYKLDLQALGGAEGEAEGAHVGELPWRLFSESVLGLLPFSWRHPHDGGLQLASFQRTRRQGAAERARAAAASHAKQASGAHGFGLAGLLRSGVFGGAAPAAAASGGAASGSGAGGGGAGVAEGAPNAIVARRQNGIEVVHLFTGRPLCQLPLPEVHSRGGALQSHADINGDARIDHVIAVGRGREGAAWASEGAAAMLPGHHTSFGGGFGAAAASGCLGVASSGLPVRDVLWNTTICPADATNRVRKGKGPKPYAAAAPLLLPSHAGGGGGGRRMDSVFLVSSGRVSAIGADGAPRWSVQTAATWRPHDGSGVMPSLSVVPQGAGAPPLILAVGDKSAVLVSASGRLLASTALPSVPVAPPLIADFDLDGVADVVVARSGYYGLRTSLGTGSLAVQVLFGFFGIAVVLTLALRQQDLGEGGEGGGGGERPRAAHRSKLM